MLPSISQSLASLVPGGAAAAGSVAAGPAASAAGTGTTASVKKALAIADAVVGLVEKAGIAPAPPAKKASKAKASAAGYAKSTPKAKTASTASAAKKAGPLAFLDDPKLSIEDKLMRLLAYLNKKWDKEIEKKLKELKGAAGGETSAPAAAASKPKKGGVLGKLGDVAKAVGVAKSFFPQLGIALDLLESPAARAVLSKIGGPVLAAAASATGFPELAPLALRYGPALVDAMAGAASALGGEVAAAAAPKAASGGSPASATSGKTDGAGLSSDREAQLRLMEIQRAMDQQKEMFSLVSNILRSGHDTRMAVIQNVR